MPTRHDVAPTTSHSRATALPSRPRSGIGAAAIAAAVALALLVRLRPRFSGAPWAHGDDLAILVTWAVAFLAAAWLSIVSASCALALCAGRTGWARALSPALPPGLRRLVEVAVVASCIAIPAVPAGAAPPVSTAAVVAADQPVVRALANSGGPPITTRPAAPDRTVPPPTTTPVPSRPPAPTSDAAVAASVAGARVVVRPGDNLWRIARETVARSSGVAPSDRAVANYWMQVVSANRPTLRSGDPSLIFPGEIVALPALAKVP